MNYYKSNALYEYIKSKKLAQYKFVVGNAWQLVYGDSSCKPLLLIFATGVPQAQINNPPSNDDMEGMSLLSTIGKKANLNVKYIRFACDVPEIETVCVSDNTFKYTLLSLAELSNLFKSYGLPVTNTKTAKYLNDRSSSAYHNWQRTSLGAALTVSDIDLWLIDKNNNPEIVFELKRSYFNLERWKPFTDDYNNFKLISNLCNLSGIKFRLIYNQRIKTPFEDKIDKLKLYTIDFTKTPPITEDGIINLNELDNI